MKQLNRRSFMRLSTLGLCTSGLPAAAAFKLGLGTYTFRTVDMDGLVVRCRELGLTAIELSHPQFMLPQVKPDAASGLREKLRTGGVEIVSWYCGHLKAGADLERLMPLVKQLGVKQVSGSAERELLPELARTCAAGGIRFGIHNHYFKGRKFLYESPEDLLSALDGRSPQLFATLDTGHMIACGFDPTEAYLKLKPHVRTIHLKDEDTPGHNVVLGKGKGNLARFLQTINRERFDGLAAIEYEEGTDPREEVAACVRFVREHVPL